MSQSSRFKGFFEMLIYQASVTRLLYQFSLALKTVVESHEISSLVFTVCSAKEDFLVCPSLTDVRCSPRRVSKRYSGSVLQQICMQDFSWSIKNGRELFHLDRPLNFSHPNVHNELEFTWLRCLLTTTLYQISPTLQCLKLSNRWYKSVPVLNAQAF